MTSYRGNGNIPHNQFVFSSLSLFGYNATLSHNPLPVISRFSGETRTKTEMTTRTDRQKERGRQRRQKGNPQQVTVPGYSTRKPIRTQQILPFFFLSSIFLQMSGTVIVAGSTTSTTNADPTNSEQKKIKKRYKPLGCRCCITPRGTELLKTRTFTSLYKSRGAKVVRAQGTRRSPNVSSRLHKILRVSLCDT